MADKLEVGSFLYTPCRQFSKDHPADFIVTRVVRIFEEEEKTKIEDSDGDILEASWLGVSLFLSYEDMLDYYSQKRESLKNVTVNYAKIQNNTGRTFDNTKDVIEFLRYGLDWLSTHNKNYNNKQYNLIMELKDIVMEGLIVSED